MAVPAALLATLEHQKIKGFKAKKYYCSKDIDTKIVIVLD